MAVFLLVFLHRVGVAFSEGPKLLPFYENLVKWQLLPLYAHIQSVTFTVLPQTHNREAGAQLSATTARRRSRWRGRAAEVDGCSISEGVRLGVSGTQCRNTGP